ncbi:helix-turn-helix domain-containing protein [Nocardia sp. NPDC003963]
MDTGRTLRTARQSAGISLREVSRLTHYSPSYLSRVESGQRAVTPEVLSAYEAALGVDMSRLTAVTEKLARIDTSALNDVSVMLAATRRLEDATGPVAVLPAVAGISAMTDQFVQSAPARNVTALASEVSQFRGWLEHATGASGASRRSLGRALNLAKDSGHPDRLVHGLSFAAYVLLESGDRATAQAMSDAAMTVRGADPHLHVYEQFQRARIHALAGEAHEADRLLLDADKAITTLDGETPPDSGYWYGPGFYGLQRSRVLRTLGRVALAQDEVRAAVDALPPNHFRSEWAAKWRAAADGETDVPQ